ncbi:MAG: Pyridoxamine 5'-phosphate oxidase [Ktedonobacterales bacterium]|jgi:pyridoxamine 5'-phosphate oxidase|nr:MAG: Pyridoxamine 5'-phosphate oxidase [Ktedonobacterales bacterium]
MSFADLRKEYMQRGLSEEDLDADPVRQFQVWFDAAVAAGVPEPNAMTLATATAEGRPSARMVLLKGMDAAGFVFYTNYESRKGGELAANPYAALVFFWVELERQVRIEGRVERVSAEQSDTYFHSRPAGSQLSAATSRQSTVLAGREPLERAVRALEEQQRGQEIPRPEYWGGFRVVPEVIEFWQGRPSRLHDRLRYTRQADGGWKIERLSP